MVALSQNELSEKIYWSSQTVVGILTTISAQMIALYGLLVPLLANYQEFSYEKSALNTLYFERKSAIGESTLGEESWKIDLSDKLNSRSPFHNTYCDHFATSLLSIFCCCMTSHSLKSPRNCYSRRRKLQDKWDIASEKLHSEVDLHTIVNLQRVSRFL